MCNSACSVYIDLSIVNFGVKFRNFLFSKFTKHNDMYRYKFFFRFHPGSLLTFPCIRAFLCVLLLSQWNGRLYMVCSMSPPLHLSSSYILNRWKYDLIFPCPVNTFLSFLFSFNLLPSCPARVENIDFREPPCCMLSILSAIFLPLPLPHDLDKYLLFFYILIF